MYGIIFKYLLLIFTARTIKCLEIANEYRLPDNVKPLSYEIVLTPYLDEKENEKRNFTFDGQIKIVIDVLKDQTNSITLHAAELNIDPNKILISENSNIWKSLNVISVEIRSKYDFFVINLRETLKPNTQYAIYMTYQGHISNSPNGFYRSRYQSLDDTWIAATQFAAINARKAYPCFDEPGIKALFQITMIHHKNYTALSNMPRKKTIEHAGRLVSIFEKTNVPLSTYITAFALVNYPGHSTENKLQTIYTPKFLEANVDFSLKIADRCLKFMENYTNLKYNLPKLDHLVVPEFAAGAMENWGLIMYKDHLLIFDPQSGTTYLKQTVATALAHEISHQWFGNSVSPKWWDYMWLSEGFAKYFEYLVIADLFPEWKMMEQFVIEIQQGIMMNDAEATTHPVKINVENPNSLTVNVIVCLKAGSIIKMLNNILADGVFQRGLQYYLTNMNNKAADTGDLWRNIQKSVDESSNGNKLNITAVGNSWINNPGLPLVTVKRVYSTSSCIISQTRFFSNEFDKKESVRIKNLWWIPIKIVTQKKLDFTDTLPSTWLIDNQKNISVDEKLGWIILNPEQTGYFRVNYDDVNWYFIISYLKSPEFTKIPPTTRAQLVDDALNLAAANYLNYEVALSLTEYLQQETDYIPWYAAVRTFSKIKKHAASDWEFNKNFKMFMQKLLTNFYEKISVSNSGRGTSENHFINLARNYILPTICYMGLKDCIETSKDLFNQVLSDSVSNLSNDLKFTIYCYGIEYNDQNSWDKLYQKYLSSNNDVEKMTILLSLGCTNDRNILEKFLGLILNKKSEIQDKDTAFKAIYSNLPEGLNFMLDFINQDNSDMSTYDKITLIVDMATYLVTAEQKEKFNEIIKKFDKYIQNSLETTQKIVTDNVKWHSKYARFLSDWFESRNDIIDDTSTLSNEQTKTELFETTTPDGSEGSFIFNPVLILSLYIIILLSN